MRKPWKPEAQARGWAAATLVDKQALNQRQADESGTFVLLPNPSLALQAFMTRVVSFRYEPAQPVALLG